MQMLVEPSWRRRRASQKRSFVSSWQHAPTHSRAQVETTASRVRHYNKPYRTLFEVYESSKSSLWRWSLIGVRFANWWITPFTCFSAPVERRDHATRYRAVHLHLDPGN